MRYFFKQSQQLEKTGSFKTQKRNETINDFDKNFYRLLNSAFSSDTMENFGNRLKPKLIKKDDNEKTIEQQSKLTFNGFHKSSAKHDG